jgi:L-ascorbate metabolism protein UlaG (beta-lactamase superfamily)
MRIPLRLLLAFAGLAAGFALCEEPGPEPGAAVFQHAPRSGGRFQNNDGPLARESFLKWQWSRLVEGVPKAPDNGYRFPLDHPDTAWLSANRSVDTMTWIGHATALLQVNGVNILTDPMFSERASPFSFIGPKRKVPPALALDELPHIDIVLVSHSHYDHLDTASVEALNRQTGGPPLFLVPLGIKAWMADKGIDHVEEFDWGDRTQAAGLDIWFVPSQHWSKRTLTDRDETLWGGWVVKTRDGAAQPFSFYFAGDTGYSSDFKKIGAAFGCFDLALIPIGAYAPRWFMRPQHVNPQEAVKIFEDVHAKRAIGIHWGTFQLSDEPLDEPPKLLEAAARDAGLPADAFTVLRHGQSMRFTNRKDPCSP